jgi:mono/diheme cytochrome c family protein
LRLTINDGGPAGQSNMPAWGDTLNGEQIDDIIAWFQSLWPGPIYEAWYGIEERARKKTAGS